MDLIEDSNIVYNSQQKQKIINIFGKEVCMLTVHNADLEIV